MGTRGASAWPLLRNLKRDGCAVRVLDLFSMLLAKSSCRSRKLLILTTSTSPSERSADKFGCIGGAVFPDEPPKEDPNGEEDAGEAAQKRVLPALGTRAPLGCAAGRTQCAGWLALP